MNSNKEKAVIGNKSNFWLYSPKTGFDLTHPSTPDSSPVNQSAIIETTTLPITIDPVKTALIIIDMQNFFLSPLLGRKKGKGHIALDNLVEHAIPACRKANIQIVWLNWGLTDEEVEDMPPAMLRSFGHEALPKDHDTPPVDTKRKLYTGLGSDMGTVQDTETGEKIQVGRMLMRDTWNAALYSPLNEVFSKGQHLPSKPDMWIHKNRMSGMWGSSSACCRFLEEQGIRTLLFAGVNTDQCVGGTYQDCFSKGYDCVLLSDACGTTSPEVAQQGIEYNAAKTWGFVTTCKELSEGVVASM